MYHKRLLLIGIFALPLVAVFSVLLYIQLPTGPLNVKVPTVDVVIAAHDIPVGAQIGDQDLQVVKYAVKDAPIGFFHEKTSVIGLGATQPIRKGEVVWVFKIASFLPTFSREMRVVTVRVDDIEKGIIIAPGTRVDVLATRERGSPGKSRTITVLENVPILATGTDIPPGEPPPMVTLVVSPKEARKLITALALQNGRWNPKIRISLRKPDEAT
jgi:pilus assembly protein CpaB